MNNVYIRNKKSIKTISLMRILCLVPLIIYGFYRTGIYLYTHKFCSLLMMFKPLLLILTGALIGGIVNIIYELLIKHKKDSLSEILFSSFHIEYGIVLGCISSINTNLAIFAGCLFVLFFISKFFNNHINIMAVCFIAIYLISLTIGPYIFESSYELSKTFSLNLFDYLIGRAPGGIASNHIILLFISVVALAITNNNKTEITIASIFTYSLIAIIYAIITKGSILNMLFLNNYLFIYSYIATDSVTSSYTNYGKIAFGILIGLITFGFWFLNPVLAPFIAIIIVSILNNLIDRICRKISK